MNLTFTHFTQLPEQNIEDFQYLYTESMATSFEEQAATFYENQLDSAEPLRRIEDEFMDRAPELRNGMIYHKFI
jgi:hypothetical protein